MSAANTVIIMGRLTKDPEIREVGEGENSFVTAKFSVAVNRVSKKDHPQADFFNVVAYRKKAEIIQKYFSKGSRILVKGEMHFDTYTDKDGESHKIHELILEDFGFIDTAAERTKSVADEPEPETQQNQTADEAEELW